MKKLGFVLLGLVVLLVIAGLVAPHFVNSDQYKSKITKEFKAKTGYDINLKGEIKIALIPLPKAYVRGVTVSNGSKVLAEVEEITVYPKLLPLLSAAMQVSSVKVSRPKVTVEKNAGGYSWEKPLKAGMVTANAAGVELAQKPGRDFSVGEVKIVDGGSGF